MNAKPLSKENFKGMEGGIFHLFALCSQVKREGSATLPDSSLNE